MKRKTLLLITFISCLTAFSQNLKWAKQFGKTSMPITAYSICVDNSGNVYSTGSYSGTVDFDPGPGVYNLTSNNSTTDIFVTKMDASGNLIWARSMGSYSGTDEGYSIAVDASGNIYTIGYYSGSPNDFDPGTGTFSLPNSGIFISKLSSSGNFVWAKCFNAPKIDKEMSIALDVAGNIYTTGNFNDSVDFDPGTGVYYLSAPYMTTNFFISKLNTSGNFLWAQNYGSNVGAVSQSLCLDAKGNIYVVGIFWRSIDFDLGPGVSVLTANNYDDIFILKLDSSAKYVWAKSFDGTLNEQASSVCTDISGNVYTTGFFPGGVDFDPDTGTYYLATSSYQNNSAFISKLDASGKFVWAKKIGSNVYTVGYFATVDSLKNVYSTGAFAGTVDLDPGTGTYSLTAFGSDDIYISKLDSFGNFVWADRFGGHADDAGLSIAIDAGGNILSTGYFTDSADFNPGTDTLFLRNKSPNHSAYILKLCSPAAAAGAITGSSFICSRTTATFSVNPVKGATSYTWSCPTGATIISGQNSNSISVTFGQNTGNISVTPQNSCGNGTASNFYVTVHPLRTVGVVASPSSTVCAGTAVTLSGTGVTSYIWSGGISNGVPFVPTSSIKYIVTGTDSVGCKNTDSITITVHAVPSFKIQPSDKSVKVDSTARFIAETYSVSATLQWQQNTGTSFTNLSNGGKFSGVTKDTLVITAVALSQNNYYYRCIALDSGCSDTGSMAKLSVTNTTGIMETDAIPAFTIYPNPSKNEITISSNCSLINLPFIITDQTGRMVMKDRINNSSQINIRGLDAGFYFLQLGHKSIKTMKLVIE